MPTLAFGGLELSRDLCRINHFAASLRQRIIGSVRFNRRSLDIFQCLKAPWRFGELYYGVLFSHFVYIIFSMVLSIICLLKSIIE